MPADLYLAVLSVTRPPGPSEPCSSIPCNPLQWGPSDLSTSRTLPVGALGGIPLPLTDAPSSPRPGLGGRGASKSIPTIRGPW
ncbi:unnamed protein product [Staurois parvus]|uniref:Uncharacterized protein n=1 Tax=Staurois parvus TaxID=386267 RepID=A0ABN9ANE1_9NEOB|nr:unnamed protein product [Staurois parvus]